MQMTGKVLLDAEEQPLCRFGLLRPFFGNVHIPGRLRRRFEVALLFIFLENHESVSSFQLPASSSQFFASLRAANHHPISHPQFHRQSTFSIDNPHSQSTIDTYQIRSRQSEIRNRSSS